MGFRQIASCTKILILGILLSITVAACDASQVPPAQIPAICKALIGPIKYNSHDKMSKRYAAYLLSLDLKARNRIGVELGCPQYRR